MTDTSLETKTPRPEALEPATETAAPVDVSVASPVDAASSESTQPQLEWQPGTVGQEILKTTISVILVVLAFVLGYILYSMAEEPEDQAPDQLVTKVSTTEVKPFFGQIEMEVAGTVVPFREIRMAAEVSGNVIKKYPACEAGNFVRKGDVLLEIDPEDYQLQLDTRKSELEQSLTMLAETEEELSGAKKSLELAQRDFELAKSEFARNQRIQNALSSSEFDQSKRALLNAETQLTTRKNSMNLITARLKRMESAVELSVHKSKRAELNLNKAVVIAPDDGIIVSESIQEGEFVNAGKELLILEDTSRSEVICNLSSRDIDWLRENSPLDPEAKKKIEENKVLAVYYLPRTRVKIFEPKRESIVWDGVLERFDGIGRDNRARTIPTRITIAQPIVEQDGRPHALVRNMYVKCQIQVPISVSDSDRRFVYFPELALRPDNSVWVVTAENKLKQVPVSIVDRTQIRVNDQWKKVVVLSLSEESLQPGDVVVESPVPSPREGMEVQVENRSKAGNDEASIEDMSSTKTSDDAPTQDQKPDQLPTKIRGESPKPATDTNTLDAQKPPEESL